MRAPLAAALAAAALLASAASSSSATPTTDEQLSWIVGTLNGSAPPSAAVLRRHFSASFLRTVPPAQLVDGLISVAGSQPFHVKAILSRPDSQRLQAEIEGKNGTSFKVSIQVTAGTPHLIDGLLFEPVAAPVSSWRGVDSRLRKLASAPSLYAAEVDGKTIHALDAKRVGAIGSAFKLYVLGALASAVEAKQASWNEQLAIRNAWKSLPSGDLRNAPNGKRFTLRHYADLMISQSDNTAADHLIHRLGRDAVEAQLEPMGNSAVARNEPFLTTRELFELKLTAPAALRQAFGAARTDRRRALLPQVDALGLAGALKKPWPTPRAIGTLEWFASPRDLGRGIADLVARSQSRGLAPLRSILSINPGVQLDRSTWSYVGFKGGSEPGVLSLTWYLVRHDGKAYVLSLVLNDPRQEIDTAAAVSAAQGAIALLGKRG